MLEVDEMGGRRWERQERTEVVAFQATSGSGACVAKRGASIQRPDDPMSISVRHARHPSIATGRSYSGSPAVSNAGINHDKTQLMPEALSAY